ncbi:minor capsid protein [Pasteurella multocida]|uniref:phage minor head protein n=1 Tax=Pasteurella multocida TaxID=747 RepID=UPI002931D7B0|nr:phage minor head protein [Pasteurella multocida]WNY73945.1 minor capsid protein [Pasteurella multocida]
MSKSLSFLFGLEPKQAIEFLYNKRMLANKDFNKEHHDTALARATTISKLTSLEMMNDIYKSIEKSVKEGKSFQSWKKDLVAEFERKGWVFGHDRSISHGIDGKLLADPKSGEYFGTPRRLNTIYRTNVQAAYSAAQYQRFMDNVDNRPYWQYSAVGDERTRPSHLALHGRVYRYDDPFWFTFYPPNGFNCRCTVMALSERDLRRSGRSKPDDSSDFLVKVKRPMDKNGNQETTVGFKLLDGSIRVTDKGFDYNVGRLTYKPNLDLYPEKLAHQFAKTEMKGAEFKLGYKKFEKAYFIEKEKLGISGRITNHDEVILVQRLVTENFHFAAGRLSDVDTELLKSNTSTVWLSDQSLVKQFNSRLDDELFDVESYQFIPDVIFDAENVYLNNGKIVFIKRINGKPFEVVLKNIQNGNELFLLSARWANEKKLRSEIKKYEVVR